jgi:hypothetical protein
MHVHNDGRAFACAALDPSAHRHLIVVALALHSAGSEATETEVVDHFDLCALEALVYDRLQGPTAELVLSYLHALTPAQCRSIGLARNRLELELAP